MRALEAFPPGHPSSPYQADGSRRPAEPSLRSLELPIPDEIAQEWGIAPSGGRGKEAGGGTGYADGWHGDSAGRSGDRAGWDGNTRRGDWNGDGSTGRLAGTADEGTRKADDRSGNTTELTARNHDQAEELGDVFIPEESHGKRGTVDNTVGRTRADNRQTADAMGPPEGIHRSYWTEVPRFNRMWDDHESVWPKECQPAAKIDRAGDPPGSWRSDSNLFLSPDIHARAKDAINRSRDAEPRTTTDLRNVVDESPASTELVSLEFRCKGEDRLKEKIAEALQRRPDSTPEETVQNINDTIRYTMRLSRDNYVQDHRMVSDNLQERGYELYYQENHWDDPEYKGINTRWLTPDGQKFELQFHTPESYHAKQEVTHEAYERIRNPLTTEDERPALEAFQAEVCSWIPVPADVMGIPSFPRKGP